ncbi:ABC transporter substrate-binding protein [Nocardioides sp. T2.26MG-1]|uniref:ABC transporter substrate-binding protein n=1 Tax=Nocardioides sp. T2.26MG-1 TaxID=3041166 RepID=UPI002477B52D|nr:ABC transporter substrate-binding protein [Nocardioides sp. T2.26MG-1]CAI9399078.1 hypothetical protein HIDPHFAB_00119 [Nocardioides sp. T2.26MG-1]
MDAADPTARLAQQQAGAGEPVRVGALAPLSPPGWVAAGQHLVAGLELAATEVNEAGGIAGRPLKLVVRDTAADPGRAAAAVDELADLGVVALAGEYHSVVARGAAARAHARQVPFLCSSAVLDQLVDEPTDWVARLAPAQSHGWGLYADFLVETGHTQVALATQRSIYWASGAAILRTHLARHHGGVVELDMDDLTVEAACTRLADSGASALLLLTGYPGPAVPLVNAVRLDPRLHGLMIGAPAGQPELADRMALSGAGSGAIPFLRYLPRRLDASGERVERALLRRLGVAPSFVALEGYDAILVLAHLMAANGAGRAAIAGSWGEVATEGTRGTIAFSREPGLDLWQWRWAPTQVTQRDPARPEEFQVLRSR